MSELEAVVARIKEASDLGQAMHRALMTEEIRAAKEAAWDEGHNHCFHVEDPNNAERNPYRKTA